MNFPFKTLLPIVTFALLAGCGPEVKRVDYAPTPEIPETAHPSPIKFSGLELILPPGMDIGNERSGIFCQTPGYPVNRNTLNKAIDDKFIRQTFHDALTADGYDVVGSLDVAFDPEDEEQRAEYAIKATLKDAQLDMCSSKEGALDFFNPTPGEGGEMYVSIDWSVYDYLKRTVVYKTTTEGYTRRKTPNQEGLTLMFQDAFEMAAHNLAAGETFRALMVNGVKPQSPVKSPEQLRSESAPRKFDTNEHVAIAPLALSVQPFAKTADTSRKAAVTIQKIGHGSGVFISKQGHILTNSDVVGDAKRTRIITADRKHTINAEVLRVDKARRVALLKLEEIPKGYDIPVLPIRLDWPKVSEDVYAIGTPRDFKLLNDTVTKGIVSAHRPNFKMLGIRENYIQADVTVREGNSGGPLVDENGNLVGLTDASYSVENAADNGLNLFIPIQEALDRLGISY